MLTKEQLKNRKNYIGASDLPALMNESKFKTSFELFQEKSGIIEPVFKPNIYTLTGQILEPVIQSIMKIKNLDDEEYKLNENDVFLPVLGHVDGEYSKTILAEIKVTSSTLEQAKKDYYAQIQGYLLATGKAKCRLTIFQRNNEVKSILAKIRKQYNLENLHDLTTEQAVDIKRLLRFELSEIKLTKDDIQTIDIKKDEVYIKSMVDKLEKFRNLIKEDNLFITESEYNNIMFGDNAILKKEDEKFNQVFNEKVQKEIRDFLILEKEMKSKKTNFTDEVKKFMKKNNASNIENNFFKITLGADSVSEAFDKKGLKEKYPEIYDEFTVLSNKSGILRITTKKGEKDE